MKLASESKSPSMILFHVVCQLLDNTPIDGHFIQYINKRHTHLADPKLLLLFNLWRYNRNVCIMLLLEDSELSLT